METLNQELKNHQYARLVQVQKLFYVLICTPMCKIFKPFPLLLDSINSI